MYADFRAVPEKILTPPRTATFFSPGYEGGHYLIKSGVWGPKYMGKSGGSGTAGVAGFFPGYGIGILPLLPQ